MMRETILKIMDSQQNWSATNTSAMRIRSELVNRQLPAQLKVELSSSNASQRFGLSDLRIEGRDGTGLKSEVPWVRLYSATRSPSATQGWYIVYLFSPFGDQVFLSLNQGTTRWEEGEFKSRPAEQLQSRVDWAKGVLGTEAKSRSAIVLKGRGRPGLGRQYERGNVLAFSYNRASLPPDSVLRADLFTAIGWLSTIYKAEHAGNVSSPVSSPELLDVQVAVNAELGQPANRRDSLPRLDAKEKAVVQHYARLRAKEHFMAQGFSFPDSSVGDQRIVHLRRADTDLTAVVVGTLFEGSGVVLSDEEVSALDKQGGRAALVIVHSIDLDRSISPAAPTAGSITIQQPWDEHRGGLSPLIYRYSPASS